MADAAAEEAKVAQGERVEKLEEAGAAAEPELERSAEQEAQEAVRAHRSVVLTLLLPSACPYLSLSLPSSCSVPLILRVSRCHSVSLSSLSVRLKISSQALCYDTVEPADHCQALAG